MERWNWKHVVLIILAIPLVNYVAGNLGESAGRQASRSASDLRAQDTSKAEIQAIVSSQAADGITQEHFGPAFLKNFEEYTVERFKVKARELLAAQGLANSELDVTAESVYVEVEPMKLAVVRLKTSIGTHSVMIAGIVGTELKRIVCLANTAKPIPISYGKCAEKIEEVFGITIGLTPPV